MTTAIKPASLGLAVAACLGACATPPAPPPAPQTSLGNRQCSTSLVFDHALAVPEKPRHPASSNLDMNSPCLAGADGARSVYSVFALPGKAVDSTLLIASQPIGQGIFFPHVLLFDASFHETRELPRNSFMFHGHELSVSIRSHQDERYLVALSDPQMVGTVRSVIEDHATIQAVPVGAGSIIVTSGGANREEKTYSYNGTVTVMWDPVPQ